ncbi:MAG: DinB family protein [Acidimicrobiales bacterium]
MERCAGCGFAWEAVSREDVTQRVRDGAAAIADHLAGAGVRAAERPEPQRWSAMEYAAHVRDVLLVMRDRFVVGLVEDVPSFMPMYRDERVQLGLYGAVTAEDLAGELAASAAMFGRLFDAIDPSQLGREVHYGWPEPAQRSLLWMGQQVVHEVEHHLGDITGDLEVLAR